MRYESNEGEMENTVAGALGLGVGSGVCGQGTKEHTGDGMGEKSKNDWGGVLFIAVGAPP